MTHRNRKFLLLIASLFIICGLALQANATTLARMDLNTLASSAEIIVRVRCIHSETKWESETIWTFADFAVLETFKGAPTQVLRVRLPGGRMNHTEVRIEGVPIFITGEELVLFVEKTSAGDYGVTSWAQGTFRIHREKTGDARLTQDSSHFAVFDPRTRQFATEGVRNLPINDFRNQLASALANPPAKSQQHSGSKQ
jgi:hypothetical protein